MMRLLILLAVLGTIGSVFALYGIKYDTRQLERRVAAQQRALEKAGFDIAVLKSERAYLGRPDRIERLARELGLAPIEERQYVRLPAEPASAIAPATKQAPAAGTAR